MVYKHGSGFLSMVTRWAHHCKAVLEQKHTHTHSEGLVRQCVLCLFLTKLCKSGISTIITFSSPAATLKASSMTEPTAMRTAADECISFHTVSLSTCKGAARSMNTYTQTDRWTEMDIQASRERASPLFPRREGQHTSSG